MYVYTELKVKYIILTLEMTFKSRSLNQIDNGKIIVEITQGYMCHISITKALPKILKLPRLFYYLSTSIKFVNNFVIG